MADYLLVDEITDEIAGYSSDVTTSPGYRCVKVSEQSITGDPLPAKKKFMTGGKLTPEFVYTKPDEIPEDPLVVAFKSLDPNAETGALKTLIKYLQR